MTLDQAKEIVRTIEGLGFEAEVYENYSGRCMYGRTTTGVVTQHGGMAILLAAQMGVECELATDSLGLKTIVYDVNGGK